MVQVEAWVDSSYSHSSSLLSGRSASISENSGLLLKGHCREMELFFLSLVNKVR
jgi:hypothetical protein